MNALGDGFATPLICDAMVRQRAACIDPADEIRWSLPDRNDPANHSHITRWEPWVRSYLCAQSLVSNLRFHVYEKGATDAVRGDPGDPAAPGKLPEWQASGFSVTLTARLNRDDLPAGDRVRLVTLVRPPAKTFREQVRRVLDWADLREERMPEVLAQIGNTYAFWGSIIPVHADRLRNTREILDAAVQFATFVEMRFKHELACWRPFDLSPQVQPMITTPGHGALPSGHCVESYVIKEVLQLLLGVSRTDETHDSLRRQFSRTAARIATNRVVAGVHFPIDNLAGRLLGRVLGRFFAFCCGVEEPPASSKNRDDSPLWHAGAFVGPACDPLDIEFDPEGQPIFDAQDRPDFYHYEAPPQWNLLRPEDNVLKPIWKAAKSELALLRLSF